MEIHRNDDGDRKIRALEYELWSGATEVPRWECGLKSIPTKNGQPPDYCGGKPAHSRRSHTIPANIIKAVNGGSPYVVTFSLKSQLRLKDWKLDTVKRSMHDKTSVRDATVGHYACDWHDNQVFGPIDEIERVTKEPGNSMTPALFALRAVLMQRFLSYRHWRLFDGRYRHCLEASESFESGYKDCACPEGWRRDSKTDHDTAQRLEPQVRILQQESSNLVSLVKNCNTARIVASQFFLPGTPGIGGTMVFNQRVGGGITCTISPVDKGHHVYITRHQGIRNTVAKFVTDIVAPYTSDASKRQAISELVLQQNKSVFITMPKWRSMQSTGEQTNIRDIAEQVYSSPPRKFRALKDDQRVPNLLS